MFDQRRCENCFVGEKRLLVVFFHVDLEANVRFIIRTFSAECLRVSPASVSSLSSSSDFLPVKSAPLKQHRGHFRGFCSTSAGDLISGMLFEAAPPHLSSLLSPPPFSKPDSSSLAPFKRGRAPRKRASALEMKYGSEMFFSRLIVFNVPR